ncbi:helicase-related protein [Kineosporia succinea]|uniref:helicase-related protein n=1 Tax=Kineosporia succinea TaxID=84632 RepID=UPI00351FBBF1
MVVIRDEEWLVTAVEQTPQGQLLTVQGLSELVRETTATFYEALEDNVLVLDPADAQLTADESPHYRRSRLWVEATLRKTAVPLDNPGLAVATRMLARALDYQQSAVRQALDPANLRPRILLADAVGLGKTLEIGMILSELARRGRGERILIVSPRHVLEQMQQEMWNRFGLPFVRLDSVGIQRVRQKLPATRNPFTYYKRVIISIDTLKSDRYLAHLRKQRWDAVVIDESHNLTNSSTQNNRLARVLAPNADALILASATPHNGRYESFAELVRLLEPTAVRPDGTLIEDEVKRLVIRRHRHSAEVARTVGTDWAERKEPQNFLVPASPAENAIARELDEVWLHPKSGTSPYSGAASRLFPWTLAKAFLSSPAALTETVSERIKRLSPAATDSQQREIDALEHLRDLSAQQSTDTSGKYGRLLEYLKQIKVGPRSSERAVVFAERLSTLDWLTDRLRQDLKLADGQVRQLHGGLSDTEQQEIIDSFKLESSPIRVLVAGDIASEGVNLHSYCHELIHFDIPWSLIRIEQRNGRIDRFGQRHAPQITTLLLDPDSETFAGDLRVLRRLLEREREAHTALGDVASLMGKYDVGEEEDEIRRVLAGQKQLDEVMAPSNDTSAFDPVAALLAQISGLPQPPAPQPVKKAGSTASLYEADLDFLRDALEEVYETPGASVNAGGVNWREYPGSDIVEFAPPPDLRRRLEVLPQSYLAQRRVLESIKLATSSARGQALLAEALKGDSKITWPEAHFLGPLHPVLEWASDRALARLGRNQVFAVRGDVEEPTVLLIGTLTNRRGQVVASCFLHVAFPNPDNLRFALVTAQPDAETMIESVGLRKPQGNPGPADLEGLEGLVRTAVHAGDEQLAQVFAAAAANAQQRVTSWSARAGTWDEEADALIQRSALKERRIDMGEEHRLAAAMSPDRRLVRPLLLVLPTDHPTTGATR